MMKLWHALSDEAQNALLIAVLFVEAWFLFGVLV